MEIDEKDAFLEASKGGNMSLLKKIMGLGLCAAMLFSVGCQLIPGQTTTGGGQQNNPPEDKFATLKETLDTKIELHFNEDGKFKVMVLSDLHLHGNDTGVAQMKEDIKLLVDRENPDLIILDGDNFANGSASNTFVIKETLSKVMEYVEEKGIPWMHVYGNHDDIGMPNADQHATYMEFDHCISKDVEELYGVGNYVVPIYGHDSDKIKFAVWALDSGAHLSVKDQNKYFPVKSEFNGHTGVQYDWIRADQVNWYIQTSQQLEEFAGEKVYGMMAFHIPLQETYTAWTNRKTMNHCGQKLEDIYSSAMNSGLYSAMLWRGDVKAVVNGHDHINNFAIDYGGIILSYAGTIRSNLYHDARTDGARVFIINEEHPDIVRTYFSYLDGRIEEWTDYRLADDFEDGAMHDFNTATSIRVSGFENDTSSSAKIDEIFAQIKDGVGLDGSKGLAVKRSVWNSNNMGNNMEIRFDMDKYGAVGENKYLMVYMDLATNGIDFRKACFGVLTQANDTPYKTDNKEEATPFYYKADGTDTWVELSLSDDGCFGKSQDCSVAGYKGWFAIPLEDMLKNGEAINSESVITGFYFYGSYASSEMADKEFYLDNFTFVSDYTQH